MHLSNIYWEPPRYQELFSAEDKRSNPYPQGAYSLVKDQGQQTGNDKEAWQVLLESSVQGVHEGAEE